VKGAKTGRSWLAFSFVLVFDLVEKKARNFVIDEFGNTLRLSFDPIQLDLLDDEARAGIKEQAAKLVDAGLTSISTPDGTTHFDKDDATRLRREASALRKGKAH
jgi:hypothetical protein